MKRIKQMYREVIQHKWTRIVLLCIVLYVFLLSIQLMGDSFKFFGRETAESILAISSNPFVALFIGILATSLVQSSSVTTSVIVTLTASGVLNASGAIPMIMGANIGTSVTNTIVSIGHIRSKDEFTRAFEAGTVHDFFNFIGVLILFPLEMTTHILERLATYMTGIFLGSGFGGEFHSPLKAILQPVAHGIEGILANNGILVMILAFAALYVSLSFFVKIAKSFLTGSKENTLSEKFFNSPSKSFAIGMILTAFVQSSSVATSIAVPLVGIGVLTLEQVFPYILGANIGTTFTCMMASIVTGSPIAMMVAFEHFLFNTITSAMIWPIRKLPIGMSRWMASLSYKSKVYPLAYVGSVFYLLPGFVIFVL